jgi:hypothetical protein
LISKLSHLNLVAMKKVKVSLEFKNGVIQDPATTDPEEAHIANVMKNVVEPIIVKRNLSGSIEIILYDDRAKINYINVEPVEYVPQLSDAVTKADSYFDFNLN